MATVTAQALIAECRHCGSPSGGDEFCCSGCRTVWGLLHREGLERYYDLRGDKGVPVADLRVERADRKWLEPIAAELAAHVGGGLRRIALDIQGIHCAACVWLIEELFRRAHGGGIIANPALGKLELCVDASFALTSFVEAVEGCGYRLGPAVKEAAPRSQGGLLARMGVCIALSMNTMIFGISIYAGLSEGVVYRLFLDLQLAFAALAVIIGGSVFFASAWRSLRLGILHLDLPIALGILLAFGSSLLSFATQTGGAVYFDTITIFITLMLVGRFLQERVVEKNRRLLLADDGVDGLLARRIKSGKVELVPGRELAAGDRLLLAPGDLLVVEALLDEEQGTLSLDWVTGESAPRAFLRGEAVPAGAFNVGRSAVACVASADFADSSLIPLLRSTRARELDAARANAWWRRLSGVYVLGVIFAALGGLAFSLAIGRSAGRALDVTAAVLILTCPCAFGIATPLAYELIQGGLRRRGLFIRSAGFLDRALGVRRVVFDKTGTLTTGTLKLADPSALADLSFEERRALYDLAARSAHPKSAAVARALEDLGDAVLSPGVLVVEEPGRGLSLRRGGIEYALGAGRGDSDVLFTANDRPRAWLATTEELRVDAAGEIRRLAGDGHEVWILSGDSPERVRALAALAGVPAERTAAGMNPEAKALWLAARDQGDTLFVGDGLNDALAAGRATCSGTPAIDRPFMPARADFYYVTPGLGPIRTALAAARRLGQVTRRNLAVAIGYNAIALALAYAGMMSPLLCAILMPASSLTVVSMTVFSLSRRSKLWTS